MMWTVGDRFRKTQDIFLLLLGVQTVSGVYPVSHQTGIRGFSPGVKQQGREPYHSTPSSAELYNGVIPPLPHTSSWRGA
jgi:hypothetical protein